MPRTSIINEEEQQQEQQLGQGRMHVFSSYPSRKLSGSGILRFNYNCDWTASSPLLLPLPLPLTLAPGSCIAFKLAISLC